MTLIQDVRRVLRSNQRARSQGRLLRDISDHLGVIARGIAVIVRSEYGVDLYAPPVAVNAKDDMMPSYVNDHEQAIREAQEQLERELAGAVDVRSEFEKALDSAG